MLHSCCLSNCSSALAISGTGRRLSKPLIGDDGRVYACSEKNLFAFESNGSLAWSLTLNYTCNMGTAPVHGGRGKLYLIAENRLLKINFQNMGASGPVMELFFGPAHSQQTLDEIVGVAVSTLSSSVFINIKSRGLFAYTTHKQLLWSAGPVLNQYGYQQGCRKDVKDCYFASSPVIDQCEASIYISNTKGELYSLSVRSPYFKWILDLSSFDNVFTVTPGNNGRLYITLPVKSMILAVDVSSGNVLWQASIGPLSSTNFEPVIDSHGWISIGSLDGFLYSFSPTGILKKFPRATTLESVIQVSPFVDCSGYAVYICQTEMEGKTSHTIGDYTYISALKPISTVFTLMVPATGKTYWSQGHTGQFSSLLSESYLQNFVVDEGILLAFITASKTGNPLPCRSTGQKLASSCSQGTPPKDLSSYTGREREIILFLLFESLLLVVLAALVRFCCIFWRKKELKDQQLGSFLEKRRSLQVRKKAFDRTITELKQKAAEEAMANEVIEEIGSLVKERQGIERKLSTTYSLGRDGTSSKTKSHLPLYNARTRSYSFQGPKRESVTIFHGLSDTSSVKSSSDQGEFSSDSEEEEQVSAANARGKAKMETDIGEESSSDDELLVRDYKRSPLQQASTSKRFMSSLYVEQGPREVVESMPTSSRNIWLKRRTLSWTN
ncbi:hypothetical protein SLA2020_152650 [Shorea laevis]